MTQCLAQATAPTAGPSRQRLRFARHELKLLKRQQLRAESGPKQGAAVAQDDKPKSAHIKESYDKGGERGGGLDVDGACMSML